MIHEVTEITHVMTKQDMSRWTRAHADSPGLNWSVYPGPGGTMIIVEHAEDRCTLNVSNVSAEADAVSADASVGTIDDSNVIRASA